MNKLKSGLLFIGIALFGNVLNAQTIEEGRKFLYYERYKSAKAVFEKLVAANPANVDAAYWLGQAMIGPDENKDIADAKALYQKTLMANSNSPILLAGMGHIELLENKAQDAKNRFETAISLSQGKSAAVLNAIGFANVNAPNGDVAYAIDKLKLATSIKGMKDPDVFINLGDAYKKQTEGGLAQTSYENALAINPGYARASYRIGKIYQTQGVAQEEIYMRYYNEAIAKDPAYGPVYENLNQYYYLSNVGKSAEFLEKYLANSDDDPKNCYYRASMKYAQGLFAEAITKADECLTGSTEPYPNLYGVKAYAYNKLKDTVNSKASFETYFLKQTPEKIGPTDYETYARILLKFPGNEQLADTYIEKAVAADTTENGKVAMYKSLAVNFEAQKNYKLAAYYYNKIVQIKKDVRKTDFFNAGNNFTKAGDYQLSIDIFDKYIQKFPNESFGYYMNAKNYLRLDSTDAAGKGLNSYQMIIDMSDSIKDKPGEMDRLKGSLRYMIEYYANVKKDRIKAVSYVDKAIMLDSSDFEMRNIKDILTSASLTPTRIPGSSKETKTTPAKQPGERTTTPKKTPKKKE